MQSLRAKLTQPGGLDLSRFVVDAGFTFVGCAHISDGARQLAQYIAQSNAAFNIVLLGYSMGGLVARDLIVNNYVVDGSTGRRVLDGHVVTGLITLGTPNWGYPWESADELPAIGKCSYQVEDMKGWWNPSVNQPSTAQLGQYLSTLKDGWSASSSYGAYWLAAAGTNCTNPFRNGDTSEGCLYATDVNGFYLPNNDGVVCRDSALYSANSLSPPPGSPTATWEDPHANTVHTQAYWGLGSVTVFCPNIPASTFQLFDPPVSDPQNDLFPTIVRTINGVH